MKAFIQKKLLSLRNIRKTQKQKKAFRSNKTLTSLYAVYQNSPEGKWIIGKNDACALYELIRAYQPTNVLELGGGIGASAAIIACAMERGTITSVEQFEKCIRIANQLTPPDLAKKIIFVYAPPVAFKDERISPYQYFSNFDHLPTQQGPFDFLIIDGPGYWVENKQLIKLPNGDLFKLIPHLAPGAKIYIDGRKPALILYKRFLHNYVRVIQENQKYALLERTAISAPAYENMEITDYELARRLKNTTYFND